MVRMNVMMVAVATFFASSVLAQANPAAPGQQKEVAAKTEAERRAHWEASFKKADTDGNGGLSKAELDKSGPKEFPAIKKHFDKMDADKDGKVTMAERDAFDAMHDAKHAEKAKK